MHHNPGAVRKIPQGQKNKTPEPKKKTKTKNKFGVVFVLRRSARKCRGNLGFDESIEAWASWRSAGPKQRKPTNKKLLFVGVGGGVFVFGAVDFGYFPDGIQGYYSQLFPSSAASYPASGADCRPVRTI